MPFSRSGDSEDTVQPCHKARSAIRKSLFHTSEKPLSQYGKASFAPQKSLFRNTEKPLSHHQKARSAPPESPLRKPSTYNTLSHRHLHTPSENHIFQPKTLARHEKRSHPDVQFNTCRTIIIPTRTRTPDLIPSPFPLLTLPPSHPPTFSFTFLPFYLFTSTKPSPLLTLPPSHRLALFFILFNHPTI